MPGASGEAPPQAIGPNPVNGREVMPGVQNYAASVAAQTKQFTVYTNTEPEQVEPEAQEQVVEAVGEPKDRELAVGLLRALHSLQEALDAAALAGLIIEPSFKKFPNRFKDRGSDADSYVARVDVYRRLA